MTRRQRPDTRPQLPSNRDPARDAAHARLLDVVIAHHGYVPCRRGDTAPPSWWTDDAAELQAAAAAACAWCPAAVARVCRAYGISFPREAGAYGSLTEGQRQQQHTTERTA